MSIHALCNSLYEHGKCRSWEHICSSFGACGIRNSSVHGDEPGKMGAVAVSVRQISSLTCLTTLFAQEPVIPEE